MRYILCEDGGSGYYFWSLISKYVLKKDYHMITPAEIYGLIREMPAGGTYKIGISKIRKFLQILTGGEYSDYVNSNTYIICIDNVMDNIEVGNEIELIQSIVEEQDNFHLVNYILNSALNYNEEGTGAFRLNALKIAL